MEQKPISPVLDKIINTKGQFSFENGVIVTHASAQCAKGYITDAPTRKNPNGQIHGGALATLADTVTGLCACADGGSCVTANCSIEYLRPANGTITCVAVPKKLGRKLSVVGFEMTNEQNKLIATGTFTFFMMEQGWSEEK